MGRSDSRKCCKNCRRCKFLQEDTVDGYIGTESSSYTYCKLGLEVNYLNIPMESTESKVFGVFRQLNTLMGYEIPKDKRVQQLCKQAGLSMIETKKIYRYLVVKGLLKTLGKGPGTKYILTQKLDVESSKMVNEAIGFREQVKSTSTGKSITREQKEQANPKSYTIGQKVFTIHGNIICQATITGINPKEDADLSNLTNNSVVYTLHFDLAKKDDYVVSTVLYFSDTVDGLLSLLKYRYNQSF